MKGLVAIAVVLGGAALVLGIVAVMDDGAGYDDVTLELTGSDERRTEAAASLADLGATAMRELREAEEPNR